MPRLIGIENEYICVRKNGSAISRADIVKIWKKLVKSGWTAKIDNYNGELLGVSKKTKYGHLIIDNDSGVTLIEVNYPPYPDLHTARREQKKIVKLLNETFGREYRLLGYGGAPFTNPKTVALATKCYYPELMEIVNDFQHMQPFFAEGSVQINLSGKLDELLRALNLFFRLDSVLYALFANASIHQGKVSKYKDIRGKHWDNLKAALNKSHRDLFCIPDKPFRSWKEYIVNLLNRPGHMLLVKGKFFRVLDKRKIYDVFINRKKLKVKEIEDKKKQKIELDVHDTMLTQNVNWLDVRLRFAFKDGISTKKYIEKIQGCSKHFQKFLDSNLSNQYVEIRPISMQQPSDQMTTSAFCLGIMENMTKAEKLMKSHPWGFWQKMRVQAYTNAMQAKVDDVAIEKFLLPLYKISLEGLKKRKKGEEIYLEPLLERIKNKKTPADLAEEVFKNKSKKKFLDFLTITEKKL